MTKPDFIIIGAMKCATSTLHAQLALQRGVFMTTPKEPNYFSDDAHYAKGEAWYSGLFQPAQAGDICGESSTHYTKLPDYPLTVERMVKRLDKIKLIYVIRHPIDRLVSHYIHQWSENVFKCDINEAIDRYEELTAYSCYARQLSPYIKQFGKENVLLVFTEAIRREPQKQLENIAEFIGYEGEVNWYDDLEPQNVSRQRIRAFPGYKLLVESNMMTTLRRALVPKALRERVKKRFTLQHRPVIDEQHLAQLKRIFNEDLLQLDNWMGVNITCDNYSEVVLGQRLDPLTNVEA